MKFLLLAILLCTFGLVASACAPSAPVPTVVSNPTQAPLPTVVPPINTSAPASPTRIPPTATTASSALTPSVYPSVLVLEGTYATTLTPADFEGAGLAAHEICENIGTWKLTFARGQFSFDQEAAPNCTPSHAHSSGSYRISGAQVTFTEPGAFGCSETYTYTWKLEGDALNFTRLNDDCAPRVAGFTARPWVKQGVATATTAPPTKTALPATYLTPNPTVQALAGIYIKGSDELALLQNGTWSIREGGQRTNDGTFTLMADQIAFTDNDDRVDSCPPNQEPGVYKWSLEGTTLTLTAVNDPCGTGRKNFTEGKWTRTF